MSGAAELVLPGVVHEPLAIRGPPSSGASLLPVGGELLFGEAIENPLLRYEAPMRQPILNADSC